MGERSTTVFITGASSGFGLLTARSLLQHGYTVLATMRGLGGKNAGAGEELARFAADAPGILHVLELDVTSEDSVENAVRRALEIAGTLDVVINNAGIGVGGYAEAFTVGQWRKIFDVNVLGVQRVNRAVLPAMRKVGAGLLIHVSSVMGRIVLPFAGPYTAAKWALEGMAETYRYELAGTGVDVAIVEPGGFLTGFVERMVSPEDEDRVTSYGALADLPDKMWDGMLEQLEGDGAPDPRAVAEAIRELIETPAGRRPLRTVVDPLTGGRAPARLNETSDRIQAELFEALGVGQMLSRKDPD